ncbi:unnamed protein product [Urochloa humidicola]
MASENVPLLGTRQGRVTTCVSSFTSFVRRTVIADGVSLALLPVGFGSCLYLLASTSSRSVCKTMNVPDLIKVTLEALPLFFAIGTLYSSTLLRARMGAEQPAALFAIQLVCGVSMVEWLTICMGGLSAWLVIAAGTAMTAATLSLRAYWRHCLVDQMAVLGTHSRYPGGVMCLE